MSLARTNPESIVANQDDKSHDFPSLQQVQYPLISVLLKDGFLCPDLVFHDVIAFQNHFQPQDTDVIVITKPKSGTTWLKSLVYSIVNRTRFTTSNHPLLTKNPHELVPNFEFTLYSSSYKEEEEGRTTITTSPRLFSTHLPYDALPESIKGGSQCRIVYMARNPFDTLVSYWKFIGRIYPKLVDEIMSLDDFVEGFCRGVEPFGPHWDHVLGYWKESLKRPNEVLFLKYEDMHKDGVSEVKKLAEFLGCGFSLEEEGEGVIEEIVNLCSIGNLKNLEVNKTQKFIPIFKNDALFRKGEVGDWVNHLSPTMFERLNGVMMEKFAGSNLEFQIYPDS